MYSEEQLIKYCIKQDRKAQYHLYERFAGKLYAVAYRYMKDQDEAQDVLQEAFIRIYHKLDTFRFESPLEAWLRRIVVNTALRALKEKRNFEDVNTLNYEANYAVQNEGQLNLDKEYLQQALDGLPKGCRTIFMLYAIDGYKHHEIAELLGINEGTSKSQFARAKSLISEKLGIKLAKTGS